MPVYSVNKKARFDYEILETLEAGFVLTGQEVKSIRNGGVKLTGGFITFHNDIPFLTNVNIPKYKYSGILPEYEPERSRKLLLNKKEIAYLRGKSQVAGLTIVPLSIYTKGRHIKIEIGIAKGKKKYDKRKVLKKRELDREVRRSMKDH
ncbi:SsrA-binding protein SmpB [Patescibacteria group bacterium]|nr:SsrA-binding protein SmpB [Patescibacteria group bacterium]